MQQKKIYPNMLSVISLDLFLKKSKLKLSTCSSLVISPNIFGLTHLQGFENSINAQGRFFNNGILFLTYFLLTCS